MRTELRKTDKKKPNDEDGTSFDATPEVDGESDRLVVQLTLEDEANSSSGTSSDTSSGKASVRPQDEWETDTTASNESGLGETGSTDDSGSQTKSVSMMETSADDETEDSKVSEPKASAQDTPAVTIAPAAVEAALERMSDGSGDVG